MRNNLKCKITDLVLVYIKYLELYNASFKTPVYCFKYYIAIFLCEVGKHTKGIHGLPCWVGHETR